MKVLVVEEDVHLEMKKRAVLAKKKMKAFTDLFLREKLGLTRKKKKRRKRT